MIRMANCAPGGLEKYSVVVVSALLAGTHGDFGSSARSPWTVLLKRLCTGPCSRRFWLLEEEMVHRKAVQSLLPHEVSVIWLVSG